MGGAGVVPMTGGCAMKRKILIAVEDAGVREALGKVLEEEDYQIQMAADSTEAVEAFDPGTIDLLLLDIELPIKEGWNRLERITSRALTFPIIIMTGGGTQYDTEMAAGVGALMEKPLDVLQLLQMMKELLVESKEARMQRLCGHLSSGLSFSSTN